MQTLTIAFPNGGILPSDANNPKERSIAPHTPVEVSATYGEQLVRDRFAYIYDPSAPVVVAAAGDEEFTARSAALNDVQTKLDKDAKALDKTRKDLDVREKAVTAREKVAEASQSELTRRETALQQSQEELENAQLDFKARVTALTSAQKAVVDARAKHAMATDDDAKAAAADLDKAEADFAALTA